MFTFFGNRTKTAAQIETALKELQTWSTDAWHNHLDADQSGNLQSDLDTFLPMAMNHARSNVHLESAYSAMITRSILLGIAKSQSHEMIEFEHALGVPMPVETTR